MTAVDKISIKRPATAAVDGINPSKVNESCTHVSNNENKSAELWTDLGGLYKIYNITMYGFRNSKYIFWYIVYALYRAPPWYSGSVLDYRSPPPVFESRRGHIWRLFRLSLRLITFGGRSAHLAYLVHKRGHKTSIIIIIIIYAWYNSFLFQYIRSSVYEQDPSLRTFVNRIYM